jgi:hypothetical protein
VEEISLLYALGEAPPQELPTPVGKRGEKQHKWYKLQNSLRNYLKWVGGRELFYQSFSPYLVIQTQTAPPAVLLSHRLISIKSLAVADYSGPSFLSCT